MKMLKPRHSLRSSAAKLTNIALSISLNCRIFITYDHRLRGIGHPVRSAIHKPQIGRLVVGWVTTSEYLLLYVLPPFVFFFSKGSSEMRNSSSMMVTGSEASFVS